MEIRVCHLYPDLLNLYGDRGNIIALTRRATWRGIAVRVEGVSVGERVDLAGYDLAFIGGGQDREQSLIAEDLTLGKGEALREAVEEGMPVLAVCGGYQLLGRHYRMADGRELAGVGLLDLWTEAGSRRMIGNVVIETELWDEEPRTVAGFENHSGRTFLGPGCRPLGRVLIGGGNNGEDGAEGAIYRHVVGTYLHGSLLPKNPRLGDWLLTRALERRFGPEAARAAMTPLDDTLEERAHAAALRRARVTRARA